MAMTKDPFLFSLTPHRKGQAPKVRLHIRQMRADKSQPTTNENLQSWSCANLKTLAGIFFIFFLVYVQSPTNPVPFLSWGQRGKGSRVGGGKESIRG